MFQKPKTQKASALVFALTVLFILIIISLGIMGVSVIERKSSGKSAQSDKAFQVADSGVEIFRTEKKANPNNAISASSAFLCSGGTITGSAAGGSYAATLYLDSAGMIVANCGDKFADIQQIKSVGTYSGASRIVKVAVAASCDCWQQLCGIGSPNGQQNSCALGAGFRAREDRLYKLKIYQTIVEGGEPDPDAYAVWTLDSKAVRSIAGGDSFIKFVGKFDGYNWRIKIDTATGFARIQRYPNPNWDNANNRWWSLWESKDTY